MRCCIERPMEEQMLARFGLAAAGTDKLLQLVGALYVLALQALVCGRVRRVNWQRKSNKWNQVKATGRRGLTAWHATGPEIRESTGLNIHTYPNWS